MNLRPLGYAYHYSFHCSRCKIGICSLDFLFILSRRKVGRRMSAVKSLHLSRCEIGTWLGITILKASPNLTEVIPKFLSGQPGAKSNPKRVKGNFCRLLLSIRIS